MRILALGFAWSLLIVAATPAVAQTAAPATGTPADASLNSDQQAAIDRYVTAEMARQRIPGVELGIYRHGYPIYTKGYGIADLEWQTPVSTDTRMQTGSLGKQFVAAAILRLAEQGKVDINASVTRYFPEAPQSWRPIKVSNLLSHTSGIGIYDAPALTGPGGPIDFHREYSEDQLVAATVKLPLDFPVGTDWRYNNTNYMMLGILIRRVTGKFYGDWLHDEFFAPLGMRATRVISDTDVIERRASGYEIKGGMLKNQAWVSATFNATADGTIYTDVEDMARWDRALDGDAILKPASQALMWTPFQLADGKPNSAGYGFGWTMGAINGHRTIGHSGAWQGFTSYMVRYPDDGLTVTVFANLDAGHARPNNIARVVAGLVSPALLPKPKVALADSPATAIQLRAVLKRATAGGDLSGDFDPAAGYKFDPLDAADLAASLPPEWQDAPMVVIRRDSAGPGTTYQYRIGRVGNTRVLETTVMPSGKVMALAVVADPDNR